MTTKLYDISYQIQQLLNVDSDAPAIDSMLEELEGAFELKCQGVARAVRMLTVDAEKFKAEAQRMSARHKALLDRAEHLKGYLMANLKTQGLTSVKGLLTVAIQKSNPHCVVQDEDAIPEEFKTLVPASWKVARNAILRHMRETGEIVPGVDIVRGDSLRIR
ncbi:MAG: siphovirus Gp157 family protein [Dehalococcoidia bacterium]